MEGLGATLISLITNCSAKNELKIWFLCSELNANDKSNIRYLLQNEDFTGALEFVDFNAFERFGHLRSLHGDWTTYGRLLIPGILEVNSALYLDSDLIIEADILALKNYKSEKILSAVYGSTVRSALENPFFIQKLKWHPETAYFNAGVLVFNITAWKANNTDQTIKYLSEKYSKEFLSADQTLLNAVCKGDFGHLPKQFNQPWYPGKPQPENIDKAITHFVGSPKPWDLFGQIIHTGHSLWKKYNTPFWKSQYGGITMGKLIRTWKIRRSIVKNLRDKVI